MKVNYRFGFFENVIIIVNCKCIYDVYNVFYIRFSDIDIFRGSIGFLFVNKYSVFYLVDMFSFYIFCIIDMIICINYYE